MGIKFTTDKDEIIAFIESGINTCAPGMFVEKCLERFTAPTGENFLDERAAYIRDEFPKDEKLKFAFEKLANICNDGVSECSLCPVKKYCNKFIMDTREKASVNSFKMIDLFCGAGGMSLGFSQEGFVVALANDIQECCIDTYAHNHPETPRKNIILGDIKELAENITNLVDAKEVDLVIGGPPCQGFSMANRQRLIDDPRNHLYKNYVEIVKEVQPKFFVMENVKGMLPVAEQVKEDFENIGYSVVYHMLNAKDYGVPQNRERLIYIGNNIGVDGNKIFEEILENSKNYPDTVLQDALYGLKPLEALRIKNATEYESEESGYKIVNTPGETNGYIDLINQNRQLNIVLNHKARYNNDRDIEIFGRMDQGDKSDDPKIADIMPYTRRKDVFKDKYYKLVNKNVCKTITAHMKFDCNMYIHPTQARGLTPREAARVQSYPDDYFFRGAYTKTYMQIGNSVPPLLGRAIAEVVKKYLVEVEKDGI